MRLGLLNWLPAAVMMLLIFLFSAQPSSDIPDFHWADGIVKKGGHMIGYGLLALSYWRGLGFAKNRRALAWCLAILYALTDEFHQSMVPGRGPSIWDAIIYDNLGALIALLLAGAYQKKRSERMTPIGKRSEADR